MRPANRHGPQFDILAALITSPKERKTRVMKLNQILLLSVFLTTAGIGMAFAQAPQGQPAAPAGPGLTLTSSAFEDGGIIPNKYTQADQKPVSPKLQWTNVPNGTVSFVLFCIDPDTALQKTTEEVMHWIAFNIPGTARELAENVPTDAQLSDGTVQGKNRRGNPGYMGMGAGAAGPYHHYTFELFALDTKLQLGPDATRADIEKAMDGHILGKAVLVGRFHR
jgi:Raf kinase inhibitor-like YbhB/YbcL family protein